MSFRFISALTPLNPAYKKDIFFDEKKKKNAKIFLKYSLIFLLIMKTLKGYFSENTVACVNEMRSFVPFPAFFIFKKQSHIITIVRSPLGQKKFSRVQYNYTFFEYVVNFSFIPEFSRNNYFSEESVFFQSFFNRILATSSTSIFQLKRAHISSPLNHSFSQFLQI